MKPLPAEALRIMIVAGEASGDMHGARLVEAIQDVQVNTRFAGIGGPAMAAAGVRVEVDIRQLSVVGITEVFSQARQLLDGISRSKRLLATFRPHLLILIDFPDFNLHLAGHAKSKNVPVLYYVSPQIWAWRSGRVRKIARCVDHMAVILPFEESFYRRHHVPVTFVGHPILDKPVVTEVAAAAQQTGETIGLLPGSRSKEVDLHLPIMLDCARLLHQKRPGIRFLISLAPTVDHLKIKQTVAQHAIGTLCDYESRDVQSVFARSTLVLAASGTVTLEAAIAGTPMVIMYRVSPISYWIGRRVIRVNHVGLANLIAGRTVVPELLQAQATPEIIAATLEKLLDNPDRLEKIRSDLVAVRHRLGNPGASRRTAAIALKLIQRHHFSKRGQLGA